ncbi:MAG TPA: hypothetical protein VHK91_11825 [Flavisolibacter sp.]|jgi:hypothetical protein|nr:hypothetical protein [Flavisolibacter sp.]
MKEDHFYIGWQDKAPMPYKRFVKGIVIGWIILAAILGSVLPARQRTFSKATFEYGKLTQLTGIYFSLPVPHLLVNRQQGSVMIPLVGYGKHGAAGIMSELEQQAKISLNARELTLKGTLIYGDGKTLMQVDGNDQPLVAVSKLGIMEQEAEKALGPLTVNGEVVDPKCYFGVMKPGEGKAHKDCAIRCILGGIPPVYSLTDERGLKSYLLLVNANGEPVNEQVRDLVGIPSTLSGQAYRYADWTLLRIGEMHALASLKNVSDVREDGICGTAMAACPMADCKKHKE